MCHEFPWPEDLRGKVDGIYATSSQSCLPILSRVVLSLGTNLCCGASGVTKPGSSKIEAIPGRCTILLSCGKTELQSWLNLAISLITKERPYYVSRSSLGAIWTPQDWHEMASACAGLSCMTSHGVGTCWCHSFSELKSPSKWSGAGRTDLQTDFGLPKERRKVRARGGLK